MPMIKFLRGTSAELLNATPVDGALYFVTDTHRILMGTESGLQEYSAVEVVRNLLALPNVANAISGKFYYAEAENVFCFAFEGGWKQVNPDTGATSIEVVGEGNAVTSASYDAVTRKITLTMGETFATADELDQLKDYVGTIPNDEAYTDITNVVSYVNKKAEETLRAAQGGSTETAASVAAALATYKSENDAAVAAVDEKAVKAQEEVDALEEVVNELQSNVDKSVDELTDKINTDVASAKTSILGANEDGSDFEGTVKDAQKAAEDAQADVDALADKVGEVPSDKTIVQMISEAQTAATYDDAELRGLISDNATAISTEKERAEGIEGGLRTDVDAIKADYLTSTDKEALQVQINTIMNNPDAEGAINSINEFTQYVTDHGTIAEGFRADIDKNKDDIAANAKAISDMEASDAETYETKEDAAAKLEEAKQYAADLNSGMNTRVEALEAIDHEHDNKALLDTYTQTEADLADAVAKKHAHTFNETELNKIVEGDVAKWNAAEQNAKDHVDAEIAKLTDGAVKANTDAIAVLNGEAEGSVKKTVEDAVAAEAEIARAAEEANANAIKAISDDYLKTSDKEEIEGKITAETDRAMAAEGQALTDAKAYTDELANGQVKTNKEDIATLLAQLQWGSF